MRLHQLLSTEELSRVAELQLQARQVVEGFSAGSHRSHHKGFNVEFREHRPYVRGDELRSIDWKLFGKSDRLYIRQSEVDTNARCMLVFDCSGSMAYAGTRSQGLRKFDYAQRLAAALAYLMLKQQDAVGITMFDARVRQSIPCRSRPSHLTALLTALDTQPEREQTDLGKVFRQLASRLGQRSVVIIISDFLTELDVIAQSLARLRVAKHELLCFQVLDPDEADFPFAGNVRFRDLEAGTATRQIDTSGLREFYLRRFEQHQTALRQICLQHRAELVTLMTSQPLADALGQFIAAHK